MTSEIFYADALLKAGASLPMPDNHEDRGVYVLDGAVSVAGQEFDAGRMLVFRPGDRISVKAGPQGARLMLLGGATMDGPRHIWWNFVASSRERIEAAKEAWRAGDWAHGRFRLPPETTPSSFRRPSADALFRRGRVRPAGFESRCRSWPADPASVAGSAPTISTRPG